MSFQDQLAEIYPKLLVNCRHIARSHGDGEDLAQSTMEKAWRAQETYDPAKPLLPWLNRIAINHHRDIHRRSLTRPLEIGESSLPAFDAASFDAPVESHLASNHILRCIEDLPEEQRDCAYLVYVNGYTHREIADLLDEPPGTVKSRIRLATQKLREALKNDSDETPPYMQNIIASKSHPEMTNP